MTDESILMGQAYEIVSIDSADAPSGTEGDNWHRYVIAQGTNTIRGHRQGSLRSVKIAVDELVAQLNERRFGKRGRVNLVPTPKNTAAK